MFDRECPAGNARPLGHHDGVDAQQAGGPDRRPHQRLRTGRALARRAGVRSQRPGVLGAGELGELRRTFFDYPSRMFNEIPTPIPTRLLDAAVWFITRYGTLILLALIGALRMWRTGQREWVVLLAAWVAIALMVIVAQRYSWWSYHFLLLAAPTGLLAAEGCAYMARGRRLQIGLLVILLAPAIGAVAAKWVYVAQYGFCLSETGGRPNRGRRRRSAAACQDNNSGVKGERRFPRAGDSH